MSIDKTKIEEAAKAKYPYKENYSSHADEAIHKTNQDLKRKCFIEAAEWSISQPQKDINKIDSLNTHNKVKIVSETKEVSDCLKLLYALYKNCELNTHITYSFEIESESFEFIFKPVKDTQQFREEFFKFVEGNWDGTHESIFDWFVMHHKNNKTITSNANELDELDDILAYFEDFMHGEDGNKITKARQIIKCLQNIK